MKKKTPILPETVVDQIRLWERERNRLHFNSAVLYDKFPNMAAFQVVESYAKQTNVWLYSKTDEKNLILVVKRDGHENIKAFIKKNV